MKNILIIGANGFTGRQILNDLSNKEQYNATGCSLHPDILPNGDGKYHSSQQTYGMKQLSSISLKKHNPMQSSIALPYPSPIIVKHIMKRLILQTLQQ